MVAHSQIGNPSRAARSRLTGTAVAVGLLLTATDYRTANAADLPAIKTSTANVMPVCATPGRLQAYLQKRNTTLDARFASIAVDYMREGEALGVRWDIAFFQMMLETGYLSFANGSRAGDVKPAQNNFAGLGASGNGATGESFPDVATGVRAHLEHLLLYAGDKLAAPVAERTRKVQEWGVLTPWQKTISHPITYADLASQWAPKSKTYADRLEQMTETFQSEVCAARDPHPEWVAAARPQPTAPVAEVVAVPAAAAVDKISGAELARRAITEGGEQRSALGAGAAPRPGPAVKLLNPPADAATPAVADVPVVPLPAVTTSVAAMPRAGATPQLPLATKIAAIGATAKAIAPKAAAITPRMPDTEVAQPLLAPQVQAQPAPAAQPLAPTPAVTGAASQKCRVWTASYGGQKAIIVKSIIDQVANFTVLDVNEGQEAREAEAFITAYAKGGAVAGEFTTQDKALEKAFELCPEG